VGQRLAAGRGVTVTRSRRRPTAGRYPVDAGTAEILGDADRPGCWMLLVEDTPQSHVDLDDPTYLDFEYVRRIGHAIDLAARPGQPLDVVHLGAGALTLARYVAATRPGSRQRAYDIDEALIELVRSELPLGRQTRVRVRAGDAREGLATLPAGSADVVVSDVFHGARTPAALTSREFFLDAARVLRPSGVCAVNIGDGPPLAFSRSLVATVRSVFAQVCVMGDPAVLRERRYGNVVCLGSAGGLAVNELTRRCAGDPAPGRVVAGPDLNRFVGQARVIVDASAVESPAPPAGLFAKPPR